MDKNTVINIVTEKKEMTLKEKIDSFCAGRIVLHVPAKELFIKACGELKQRGIKWCGGTDADSSPRTWNRYREETTIGLGLYGIVYADRYRYEHSAEKIPIIDITEDDFRPKESTAQQVAKVVLESAKKRAGKKNPLDAMCGGIEKVTFVSTHGDSRTFYVKTSKEGDAYIIREVAIPKFIKGEKFTDENGVLGRIDDIHDRTYDCEMVTGEKYALQIDEADKKFKKITW